jgi:hypothetical protein
MMAAAAAALPATAEATWRSDCAGRSVCKTEV